MAEVVGAIASGLTLASLFKVCLDAIEMVRIAQHQDLDVTKLVLKLNIEKCRLYAWGEAVGLTTASVPGQSGFLDACPDNIQALIRDTLEMTVALFMDTQKLKQRYGCKECPPAEVHSLVVADSNGFGSANKLTSSFSRFKVADISLPKFARLALKTRWIIHDRKKFIELVAEVKAFVDGLQDLTQSLSTIARQENTIRLGVQQINDVETLDLIADVCKFEHPAIADVASERSTIISLAPPRLLDIEQWTANVVPGPDDEVAELESLTVTELKHRMLAHADKNALKEAETKSDLMLRKYLSDMNEIGRRSQKMDPFSLTGWPFLPFTVALVFALLSTHIQAFAIPANRFWTTILEFLIPVCVSVPIALFWFRYGYRRQRRRREREFLLEKMQEVVLNSSREGIKSRRKIEVLQP